jgi:branched-chain amino acid transport system permease protein
MSGTWLDISILALIYSVVVLGLNVISGYAGVFSVAQASLFAVGAFTYAGLDRVANNHELLVAWVLAGALGGLLSCLIALVSLRVAGDFFIVASFGLQLVVVQVLFNWSRISGGPAGAYGLSVPTLAGSDVIDQNTVLMVAALVAIVAYGVSAWLVFSPFGRLLRAMRDDEAALAAGGFSAKWLRLSAFVFGGVLAAVAGVLYAAYLGVAQTGDFDVSVSVMLLAAVILGGSGSLVGSLIGAVIFSGLPQVLDQIHVAASVAGPMQQLIFGALVLLVMVFARGGVASLLRTRRGKVVQP